MKAQTSKIIKFVETNHKEDINFEIIKFEITIIEDNKIKVDYDYNYTFDNIDFQTSYYLYMDLNKLSYFDTPEEKKKYNNQGPKIKWNE